MLNSIAHFVFYVSVGLLSLMCVLIGNMLDKHSGIQLRVSLNMVVLGTTALLLGVHYGLEQSVKLFSAALILCGISGWLLFGRQHINDELDILIDSTKQNYKHFIEGFW